MVLWCSISSEMIATKDKAGNTIIKSTPVFRVITVCWSVRVSRDSRVAGVSAFPTLQAVFFPIVAASLGILLLLHLS